MIKIEDHLHGRHQPQPSHGHDTDNRHDQTLRPSIPSSAALRAIAAPTSLLFSDFVTFCATISLSLEEAEASVFALIVIDQLNIDIGIASEYRQSWLLSSTADLSCGYGSWIFCLLDCFRSHCYLFYSLRFCRDDILI